MTDNWWQIQVASDIGADALLVEISYRGELWAAVLEVGEPGDNRPLRLQTFPRSAPGRESDHWDFDYEEALAKLARARQELRPSQG